MATHSLRRVAALAFLIFVMAGRSNAGDVPRLRADPYVREVLDDVARRSPRLVSTMEQIGASNVIVHVTCLHFTTSFIEGKTLWVSSNHDARYVRVQVDCLLQRSRLVAILAHELQHVAEVAAAPDVVDEPSFARLFRAIGFSTCSRSSTTEQFQTEAALAAGAAVLREYDR